MSIPLPSSISYFWNMGSLLGVCLVIQLLTGVFLTFHYTSAMVMAFESVIKVMEEVSGGWMIRFLHANGASFFFICMYLHVARGLYYKSFIHKEVWIVGVLIMFLLMGTAFLGYVLPWGQMSFWGATVITNLLSAFPKGEEMVQWIWGGFSVSGPTLTRFFSLHFILPFVILALSSAHIFFLHESGSSNPLGVESNSDKIYFHPYFTSKDLLGVLIFLLVLFYVVFTKPDMFMDPDNFIPANPMATPPHIQPEWYFLFAYAILRSIPNKLGGVIALVASIACLFFLPLGGTQMGGVFSMVWKVKIFLFYSLFILLTWVGSMPVSSDLVFLGQVCSFLYFLNFSMLML